MSSMKPAETVWLQEGSSTSQSLTSIEDAAASSPHVHSGLSK